MPIFGEIPRFAVEYSLDENSGGEWMFGRLRYWCGGLPVGDYELGTSLRDVLFQVERIERDAGRRINPRFLNMTAQQVFQTLDKALFGREAFAQAELADQEQWARHNILPAVDVFDDWKGFLIESESSGRLIIGHLPTSKVHEVPLQPGEVDRVLAEVVHQLGAIHAQQAGRPS